MCFLPAGSHAAWASAACQAEDPPGAQPGSRAQINATLFTMHKTGDSCGGKEGRSRSLALLLAADNASRCYQYPFSDADRVHALGVHLPKVAESAVGFVPDEANPRGLRVAHRPVRCIPDEKHFDCLKAAGLMVRCVLGARRGGIGRDPFPAAWSRAQGSSEQAIVVRGHRWLWADGLPSRHSHWGCDSRNIQHSGQDWFRDFRLD